jgi:hypothetical protein
MTKTIPSHETKVCTKCGIEKPLTDFQTEKHRYRPGERKVLARCRACMYAYQREWRLRDPDGQNAKYRGWREAWLAAKSPEELIAYRKACAAYAVIERGKRKLAVFEAYGGNACACCGETEPTFLTIDHVNNDGGAKRRSGEHPAGSAPIYRWLIKNNFPPGFQVLCMNCQFGKKYNGGVCPHQSRGVTTIPSRE